MKQHTLIYALIILGIIFLLMYLNKKVFLEGYTYTYNHNLAYHPYAQAISPAPFTSANPVHESTCKLQCDQISGCTGFTSDIISGSNQRGTCALYNFPGYFTNHTPGTNLYLRTASDGLVKK